MIALTLAETAEVVMLNCADDCPATMLTAAGTTAAALFDERLTVVAAVAGVDSETVPVDAVPPITLGGATCRASPTPCTVIAAVCWPDAAVAVMVTPASAGGLTVEIAKVAVVCPAGTRTVAGTITVAVALLARPTVVSTDTAAARVTVPVAVAEPVTVDGLTATDASDP